jgi:hypothetical protein
MLRVSSQMTGTEVDVGAVNGGVADAGVEHGARLLAFTEAVMRGARATAERAALRAVLTPESFVDVAAIIGAFNVVDRIADATGIPLDPVMDAMSTEIREQLGLARFASAANTPVTR